MANYENVLQGNWKLVSWVIETRDSEERTDAMGPNPNGRLILAPGNRMAAVITSRTRQPGASDVQHAELLRSMLAYTGTYRIEGDKFITTVDASWVETWNGTEQERFFKVDGNTLDITSAWMPNPHFPDRQVIRGILSWVREI